MGEPEEGRRFAVIDACWGHGSDERHFVARTVTAALACHGQVDVLVPEPPGPRRPDGAFDVIPVGTDWRAPIAGTGTDDAPVSTVGRGYDGVMVVGRADEPVMALTSRLGPDHILLLPLGAPEAPGGPPGRPRFPTISVDPAAAVVAPHPGRHHVDIHVPTDPAAAAAPFGGIGCTDYVLVLGGATPDDEPGPGDAAAGLPAAARWLVARYPRLFVLTLVAGVVTVWRNRAPLSSFAVGTRMDLWRLMAFARATVDPLPGRLVARECVEALLLGSPIVVPAGSTADHHVAQGGGRSYNSLEELFGAVEDLSRAEVARDVGARGRRYAAERFGSGQRLIDQVGAALRAVQD